MAKDIRKEQAPANSIVGHNEIAFDGKDVRVFNEGKQVGVDDIPYHTKDQEAILSASVKSPYLSFKYGKPTSYAEAGFGYAKFLENYNNKYMKRPSKESEELLSKSQLAKNTYKVSEEMASKAGVPQARQQLQELADLQAQERSNNEQSLLANKGKDKFAVGKPWRGIADSLPMITSLGAGIGQLAYFGNQRPVYQSTYVPNTYANRALSTIDSVRYDPYPQIRATQNALRQQAYINSQAGGLTGGQRNKNRIALGIGAMNAISDVYSNAQLQNNNLRLAAANAWLKQGAEDRQYMSNALSNDRTHYTQQNSAYNHNLMTSLASITGAINQGYKNFNTDRINRLTLGMYQQELNNREKEIAANIANSKAQLDLQKQIAYQNGLLINDPEYQAWLNAGGARAQKKRNGKSV